MKELILLTKKESFDLRMKKTSNDEDRMPMLEKEEEPLLAKKDCLCLRRKIASRCEERWLLPVKKESFRWRRETGCRELMLD